MNDSLPRAAPQRIAFAIFGRTFTISRFTFLLMLGVIVGAVTGLVAVVFRMAALKGEELFFPAHDAASHAALWSDLLTINALQRLSMPVLGGLITGFILFKLWHFSGSHSIPAILRAVASGQSYFKSSMAVPPALSIVTLATGGSVGPEGPIAEIGSVTGSLIGRWTQLPPKMVKTLIGSGVAAGIAAVFNAPIGGVFFAIEVILRNYEIASFTPIAVAAVVASVISQSILGDQMAISFPEITQVPFHALPLFALLGLICGLISLWYIYALSWFHHQFKQARVPLWLRPALGGLMVGVIGVFFPNVMGEGYEWIRQVLAGHGQLWLLLLLIGFKLVATGLTLGSGNPGGSFAPAVFIGVMTGAAFGKIVAGMEWIEVEPATFAIMGMAGLIAGGLGAPITAIMITLQHGGMNMSPLLLPVMTTVALSIFIMQWKRNVSVYTLEFLRGGIDLDSARESDPLSLINVKSVMHTSGFEELPAGMPVREALARFKDSPWRWFVVREAEQFVGIVSLHEMRMAIAEEELAQLLVLADITDSFQPRTHPEMNLKDALVSFKATDAEVLPVFASPQAGSRFVGVVSRQDALNAYWELTAAGDA